MFNARMNSKFKSFLLLSTFFHVKNSYKPPKTIWIVNNENTNKVSFEIRVRVNLKLCININKHYLILRYIHNTLGFMKCKFKLSLIKTSKNLYYSKEICYIKSFFCRGMFSRSSIHCFRGSCLFYDFQLDFRIRKILRSKYFAKKVVAYKFIALY